MPFSLPSQFNTTAFALMSAGHTYIAREWTSDPQFKNLPKFLKTYARAGWYQGSILFLILALINYRWSRPVSSQEEEEEEEEAVSPNPSIDRTIAALSTLLLWAMAA